MMEGKGFREPAVAGAFYPGNPEVLRRRVEDFIEGDPTSGDDGPVALICPHAGYDYSGGTAGFAYREIQGRALDAVIVLGPSHYDLFRGATFWPGAGYRTPLGDVPHPQELARTLAETGVGIQADILGHGDEHSLEVQIPFLQIAAPRVPVLPLVLAEGRADSCRRIGDAMARAIRGRRVLLVASSDLYHGDSDGACREMDERTLGAIERNDARELAEGFSSGRFQACGRGPILAVLEACRLLGATKTRVLAHTNSNEVAGRRGGYVVGYGAVGVFTG